MAIYECRESWICSSGSPADLHLNVHGITFHLHTKPLIMRSAKLAILLKEKQHGQLSHFLTDTPGDAKTFELAAQFCYGSEPEFSADNVVPLSCLASYLEMTEEHSPNNLLKKTVSFFNNRIIPHWNESVRAYRTSERVLRRAIDLGLIEKCLDSIARKAFDDPWFIGKPIEDPLAAEPAFERPTARRKLFGDWWLEDLTTLTLLLFEPVVAAMVQIGVPPEYIAGCLFRYAKKRVDSSIPFGIIGKERAKIEEVCVYEKSSPREVVEAVERHLPYERVIPCKFLFEMLRWAIKLQASIDCRKGFETRIGKQLVEAAVEDLWIPCGSYTTDTRYDIESVRRILKNFYANYMSSDQSGLIAVSELVVAFLTEVARDENLKKESFVSLAEMAAATSNGVKSCTDGIYRAIDVYLDAHRYLTESEREDVCQILDCGNMSPAACAHAVQNERLPLRVVVQVLFVGQLHLREAISGGGLLESDDGSRAKETSSSGVPESCDGSREREEEEEEKEKVVVGGDEEEEGRMDMERVNSRVMLLERECCKMKREIKGGGGGGGGRKKSFWKGMKRKFGCMNSLNECNCHVKVHPRNGV